MESGVEGGRRPLFHGTQFLHSDGGDERRWHRHSARDWQKSTMPVLTTVGPLWSSRIVSPSWVETLAGPLLHGYPLRHKVRVEPLKDGVAKSRLCRRGRIEGPHLQHLSAWAGSWPGEDQCCQAMPCVDSLLLPVPCPAPRTCPWS